MGGQNKGQGGKRKGVESSGREWGRTEQKKKGVWEKSGKEGGGKVVIKAS